MAFTQDTAVTSTTDFVKYGFEQEIANFDRDTDAVSNLQKAAVNVLIRDLKSKGITPSLVSNNQDFYMEIIYWCLMTLYVGEATGESGDAATAKKNHYMKMWLAEKASRYIVLTDGTIITPQSRGLPAVANHDAGAFHEGLDNDGQNLEANIGAAAWEQYVANRKNPRNP